MGLARVRLSPGIIHVPKHDRPGGTRLQTCRDRIYPQRTQGDILTGLPITVRLGRT
jgi:hypothetical protein